MVRKWVVLDISTGVDVWNERRGLCFTVQCRYNWQQKYTHAFTNLGPAYSEVSHTVKLA
jgi:hypothetical protein